MWLKNSDEGQEITTWLKKARTRAKRGQKVIRIGTRWGTDDTKVTAVSFIMLPKNPTFINLKIVISKKLKIHGLRLNQKAIIRNVMIGTRWETADNV